MVDRDRFAAKGVNADSVVERVRTALLTLPGMAQVYRVRDLPTLAARGDKVARRWMHSLPTDMNVALTVVFKPGYYVATTRSATHGMPYDLDAKIPVLFLGPGIKAGRYPAPIRSVDVAPTLAALAQVVPIERVDGRVLTQVLTTPPRPARPTAQAANRGVRR